MAVSLFATVPTESSQTATAATYDPWADLNGDGRIDVMDVVGMTGIYGTTGNPARDVNVTNWPWVTNSSIVNWPFVLNVSVANRATYEWAGNHTVSLAVPWFVSNMTKGFNKVNLIFHKTTTDNWLLAGVVRFTIHGSALNVTTEDDMFFFGITNSTVTRTYDVVGSEMTAIIACANITSPTLNVQLGVST